MSDILMIETPTYKLFRRPCRGDKVPANRDYYSLYGKCVDTFGNEHWAFVSNTSEYDGPYHLSDSGFFHELIELYDLVKKTRRRRKNEIP